MAYQGRGKALDWPDCCDGFFVAPLWNGPGSEPHGREREDTMPNTDWAAVANFVVVAVLAVITWWYARSTSHLVKEAEKSRMGAHLPIVVPANWAERI